MTRRRWRGRQVTDADADPADTPVDCPAFAARLPVGGNDGPEDARVRLNEATEGLLGGRWPVFGRERDDDMAPAPDWFLDPTTGRRAEMAGQFADASAFPGGSRRAPSGARQRPRRLSVSWPARPLPAA